MRVLFAVTGLLEVLARWFACQRSLKGGEEQTLQIVGGAFGRRTVYRYSGGPVLEQAKMEARSVAEVLLQDFRKRLPIIKQPPLVDFLVRKNLYVVTATL